MYRVTITLRDKLKSARAFYRTTELKKSGNKVSSSRFDPERGCVVPTSRSTSAQHRAFRPIHALRLVLCTQPRSAK